MAISILYNPAPMRIFEADGDFASGARGYFYLARTSTPLTVYTDAPLATPHTWPVIADAFGLFAPIYIAKGSEYKVRIEDQAGNILYAADGIDNPAEAAVGGGGGGGGSTVLPAQIHQTGDFIWTPSIAARTGWVRANGQTIGPPTSAASGRANLDCEALFALLWNTFPDSLCPVTPGGRGATPAADWAAGLGSKAIATLDMRGRGAAGLDDMGTGAANLIQVTTTIATTIALATATVPSTAGLCAGMKVVKGTSGIPDGTTIVSVDSATAITLSALATATATGVAVRFSMFADAVVAGSGGGENAHVQLLSEMVAHTHRLQYSANGVAFGLNAGAFNAYRVTVTNDGNAWELINTNAGGGQAANIWTPTRLGTWWIKI